jgi:ribosomal protein L24E
MNLNPAPVADETACFFCGKKLAEGQWFARFEHESRRVVFCRPFCVESFLQQKERQAAEYAAGFHPLAN